jgi:D-aspartate ligase
MMGKQEKFIFVAARQNLQRYFAGSLGPQVFEQRHTIINRGHVVLIARDSQRFLLAISCSGYFQFRLRNVIMIIDGSNRQLSVLLGTGVAGGTIAAARHLGTSGFNVSIFSSSKLCAAAWSRHVSRNYTSPPEHSNRDFINRLLEIGSADSGQILLATSDQTAWLYAEHASQLSKYFRLYQPSLDCMRRILDKKLFADAAVSAGIAVLPSWIPRSIQDVEAFAPDLPYPILIKPRTHVYRYRNDKGVAVNSAEELISQYRLFEARERRRATYNSLIPEAVLPILQKFVNPERGGVRSVSGFIDRAGNSYVVRHTIKVFQRSHPVGVGVCFESASELPLLSNAVRDLCRALSFFGLFEVEFVFYENKWNVIDFNPRLFNQVGMDIRRGAPLPLLACLDAAGETTALIAAVARANSEKDDEQVVFCDCFTFRAILLLQAITSRISFDQLKYWRQWTKRHASHCIDFAADRCDPAPGIVHALSEICLGLRALPKFLTSTPRVTRKNNKAIGRPL